MDETTKKELDKQHDGEFARLEKAVADLLLEEGYTMAQAMKWVTVTTLLKMYKRFTGEKYRCPPHLRIVKGGRPER